MDKLKKDWTESLAERFESFAEAEPEGLWDAVQAGVHGSRHRKLAPFWWYFGGGLAVAAAVAALLVLRPSLQQAEVSIVPGDGIVSQTMAELEPVVPVSEQAGVVLETARQISTAEPFAAEPETRETEVTQPLTEVPGSADLSVAEPSVTEPSVAEPAVTTPADVPATETEPANPFSSEQPSRRRTVRVHAGVAVGNLLAGNVSQTSSGVGLPSNFGTKASMAGTSGPVPQMFSRNKASTTETSHRQSARAALTVGFGLARHWGMETGVVFTSLSSSSETRAGNSSSTEDRTLRYLGIPLFVKYETPQWRRFSLFANAGPMYEFCIGGSSEKMMFTNSQKTNSVKDNLTSRDSKWSLNLGAGIQFRMSPHGALFVQPGFSWHLPDNSEQESFYTEHPAAFNVTVGYRVNLF